MHFTIDDCYLTDISVRTVHNPYAGRTSITEEEFIEALKRDKQIVSISTKDHPEFSKLREQLESDGYIKIERGWWNGDRVVKQFALNGKKFRVGEKFPCAAAMRIHLRFM